MNNLRSEVNDYQLAFNNKKKTFKYEIQLDQEREYLDNMENEADYSNLDISNIGRPLVNDNEIEFTDMNSEWPGNKSNRMRKETLMQTSKAKEVDDPFNFKNMTWK